LLGVILFGVTRFAGSWIEDQARNHIGLALDAAGHSWADLTVSGQRVVVSGAPPAPASGEPALEVARGATCPTWLGPKVCSVSVTGDFGSVPAAAPSPEEPGPTVEEAAAACQRALAAIVESDRVEFASGSETLVASAEPLLDRIAGVARDCPGVIRIEGHTDSTGDPEANQALSTARAEVVREALGDRGVSLDRLVAVGYGQSNPIAGNGTAAGRARNRRIEFRVQIQGN
jgi:outer membrane protein OmpA-like peptidoglycan-associated protein